MTVFQQIGLIYASGKRKSGTKFSPEFCLPFAQTDKRLVSEEYTGIGSPVICTPIDRYIDRCVGRFIDRHSDRYIDRMLSVDTSTECQPIYRSSVGRCVD